jgi:hypothetical protein
MLHNTLYRFGTHFIPRPGIIGDVAWHRLCKRPHTGSKRKSILFKRIIHDHNDGVDRRGFLQCMAWTGTGVIWTVSSGALSSQALGRDARAAKGELRFVQISDSQKTSGK